MSNAIRQDIYVEMYKQCHDHLRETDKKRDQLLMFYAAVFTAFWGFLEQATIEVVAVAWMLTVVGLCLAVVLVKYRKWHIIYTKSAISLARMSANNDSALTIDEPKVKDAWKACTKRSGLCAGSELWVFLAFMLIWLFHSGITIFKTWKFINWPDAACSNVLPPFLFAGVFLLAGYMLVSFVSIESKLNTPEGYKHSWILCSAMNPEHE